MLEANQKNSLEITSVVRSGCAQEKKVLDIIENNLFGIPNYQRKYDWTDKQITRLFQDFIEIYETQSQHYIGCILHTVQENSGRLEIIDGQQRITSMYLMCLALFTLSFKYSIDYSRDDLYFLTLASLENLYSSQQQNIEKMSTKISYEYKAQQTMYDELIINDEFGLQVQLIKLINLKYQGNSEEIKKPENFEFIEKLRKETNNFAVAFCTFYALFENWITKKFEHREDLARLYTDTLKGLIRCLGNIKCAIVKIKDPNYSVSVFNAINTTGAKLTSADLIRSYLICFDEEYKDKPYSSMIKNIEKRLLDNFTREEFDSHYCKFWFLFIKAFALRNGAKRSRSTYTLEDNGKQPNMQFYFKNASNEKDIVIYEYFKDLNNYFSFCAEPSFTTKLIEQYLDYYLFLYKGYSQLGTDGKDNFFNDLKLSAKLRKKLELMLLSFSKISAMDTFIADVFVLFERIDKRKGLVTKSGPKKLTNLDINKFMDVLHLLWSFVMRCNLNPDYYGETKATNIDINFVTKNEKDIYKALYDCVNGTRQESKTKMSEEDESIFIKALLKNTDSKSMYNYVLNIVNYQMGMDVKSEDTIEHVLPQNPKKWNESNQNTILKDWDVLAEYATMPSDKDVTDELKNMLHDRFNECIGNKILLIKGTNSKSSNKTFVEKLKEYQNKDTGCRNTKIIDKIKEYAPDNEWGYGSIIKMCKFYGQLIYAACDPQKPSEK